MIWRMLCWLIEEGDNNNDDDDDDDGDVHCLPLAVFIALMLVGLLLRKCLKQAGDLSWSEMEKYFEWMIM